MVMLTIHRFNLRYAGKDYRPGDKVEMEEAKAQELVRKYGSAFSYEVAETNAAVETAQEEPAAELPAPDVDDVVVKLKKTGRKK